MKKFFVFTLVVLLFFNFFTKTVYGDDVINHFTKLGAKYKHMYPNDELKKSKFLAIKISEELLRLKIKPNYNLITRLISVKENYSRSTGTCGDIADIFFATFQGAEFNNKKLYKVLVEKEGIYNKMGDILLTDLNTSHVVFGVIANGKPVTFDLFWHGFLTGNFKNFDRSILNGWSQENWTHHMMKGCHYSLLTFQPKRSEEFKTRDQKALIDKIMNRNKKKKNRIAKKNKQNTTNQKFVKTPARKRRTSQPKVTDESTRIENEFRAIYPRWVNATKSKGAEIRVIHNATKIGSNLYRVASETWRVAEAGRLKGKKYRSGSGDWKMTLGELKAAIVQYKKDLKIK